jgi:pimeloyl-ACP methyl ester carboxylesterase
MLPLAHRFTFRDQTVAWGCIGTGPPLVLIHGFPWSSQAWRRIAPCLADRHTIYYFDMLGSGASAKFAGQDVAPAVQNDLLAALLAHWEIDRPDIVAHDFGGLTALRGLFVNGLAYGSLTLFDAVAVLPSGSPFYAHVRRHEAAFAGVPADIHAALFRAYAQSAAHAPLPAATMQLYLEPWQGPVGQAAFYRWIAQSDGAAIEALQPLYRRPDCPVTLVWGEHDGFIPPHQGDALAAKLGAPAPERLPETGHLVQEDAPERVVASLLRVLARGRGPTPLRPWC